MRGLFGKKEARESLLLIGFKELARIDPAGEKELTEKVMELKLGRKLKNKTS